MSHFAKVENGIVTSVIVADDETIKSFEGNWIKTSYNTYRGINLFGGIPLRMNYAGVGFSYSEELDAFIPPRPYNSWLLNPKTCLWEAPVSAESDLHVWNEDVLSWVLP